MSTANRKLPRRPHAQRPRPDEVVRKSGGADLQNGWMGRHGTLSLCDDRLVFVPTILDTILGAKRREIPLDDIETLERIPRNPNDMPAGAKRPRIIVHTAECGYEFLVSDLDTWLDAFEVVYAYRARNGKPHQPELLRDGSTTERLRELEQ